MSPGPRPALAGLLLVAVTVVWGWTFVVVHDALSEVSVIAFLAVRFSLAAAVTILCWGRRLTWRALRTGMSIGLVLGIGYLLQTSGLKLTTATNAGLITGLFVVLAPLADRLMYGTSLAWVSWLAVGASLVGMTLLTGRLPTNLALGDLLVLGCAVAFAVHIALLSRHSGEHDPYALATAQMIGMAVLFTVLWPAFERPSVPPRGVWFALVLTGVVASAAAYAVQTAAQRVLSAVRTAVILTLEPVFAAVFGILLAGEHLGPAQIGGAVLILVALLTSELATAGERTPVAVPER